MKDLAIQDAIAQADEHFVLLPDREYSSNS